MKRIYFMLGALATVFSDHTTGLKVTKNIPGSTLKKPTKAVQEAIGSGHIQEIGEHQFWEMMDKVTPEEKVLALKEQGLNEELDRNQPVAESGKGSSADDEAINAEKAERENLLSQLEALRVPSDKKTEISSLSNDEIKKFIKKNTK